MDPTTTLFTFMLQTHPAVQTVQLVGSWDNFGRTYTMERDIRRDRGQWRGCYSFKDIICDGDSGSVPKRNGGLKQGHTYYFYYELDGASETHDPSLPSTNTCPYLPGQTVNTIWVPVEQTSRQRSASLNSLNGDDYKTMNPADKFTTPRPAPVPPQETVDYPFRRIGSAPLHLQHKRSARSLSPGSGWSFSPRRLFSRKPSISSLAERCETPQWDDERSVRWTEGSRSRDISPESLRRFLSDDSIPTLEGVESNDRPAIAIPDDIVEEIEDDDNFATSAISEGIPFTGLSPPPSQRSVTPSPPTTIMSLGNSLDAVTPSVPEPDRAAPSPPTRSPPLVPQLEFTAPQPRSRFSFSDASFYSHSLHSPQSPDSNSLPSFYHSEAEDEEDDIFSSPEEEEASESVAILPGIDSTMGHYSSFVRDLDIALSTYSLPCESTAEPGKLGLSVVTQPTELVTSEEVDVGSAGLLSSPIPNSGLDELVSELGWMAGVIRT